MPTTVNIEGVSCTIEKLPDGLIRVRHLSTQFNAMHGPGTAGTVEYIVHPCQRNQYHVLNGHLPQPEQGAPQEGEAAPRPWWSLSEGERSGLRE